MLLTNCWMADRGGTELYVRDLALGLQRAGHRPMVWSPFVGEVAQDLRAAGVPVHEDLTDVRAAPDVVHGHHGDETMAALSRFPDVPGLYVAHDAEAWQDEAPIHPRLLRYLAVDELCRERLLARGVDPARTEVVPNAVDLHRFPRRGALPQRPRRALLLANTAREDGYLAVVRAACERAELELDVAGSGTDRVVRPEQVLADYDLVFGKARVALEALAVGCAVVLLDLRGIGGMVTSAVLPEWRRWNFGRRLLSGTHDVTRLLAEIKRYDAADAALCTDQVRSEAGLAGMTDKLVEEYDRVLEEWRTRGTADPRQELSEAALRLATIGPLRVDSQRHVGQLNDAHRELQEAARRLHAADQASTRAALAENRVAALEGEVRDLATHTRAVEAERDAAVSDNVGLRAELGRLRSHPVARLARSLRSVTRPARRRSSRPGEPA